MGTQIVFPGLYPTTFNVSACYPGIQRLLANRTTSTGSMADCIRKCVWELTQSYPFAQLQQVSAITQLTQNQYAYPIQTWFSGQDSPANQAMQDFGRIISIFLYINYPTIPTIGVAATGYNLKYKTIATLETLLNLVGLPSSWTRFGGNIYIAQTPAQPYYTYCRYQKIHNFPLAGTVNEGNDVILMPIEWQEVVEIGAAMRLAIEARLYDMANEFKGVIYGDPKFQLTAGTEGMPGLIFKLTSADSRDAETDVKKLRLRIGGY